MKANQTAYLNSSASTQPRRSRVALVARKLSLGLLGMLLLQAALAHGETATEAWARRYSYDGASSKEGANKVVTDLEGNVIVAGSTEDGAGQDMLIIKYSGAGAPLWTNRYNGPGNRIDVANAV